MDMNRQPQPEKTYQYRGDMPRLVLQFKRMGNGMYRAADQGLEILLEKMDADRWTAVYGDAEKGEEIASIDVDALKPDTAQLNAYVALKNAIAYSGQDDLMEYGQRLADAKVIFTDPDGNAQEEPKGALDYR